MLDLVVVISRHRFLLNDCYLRSEVVFLYQLELTVHTKSISCLIAFEIKTISVSRGFFQNILLDLCNIFFYYSTEHFS